MDGYLLLSLEIVLLVVLICGSGFFSSCEMALFSLGRAKVMAYKDDPSPTKRRIYFLLDNYNRTLVTIILSNMFVNSCISMLNDTVIRHAGLEGAAATVASAVSGILLLLLFGEITPMTLAYVYCDPWSKIVAAPVCFMRSVLFPVVWCAEQICNRILDAIRVHNKVAIPPGFAEPERRLAAVVRDADKIDILPILLDYLEHPDNESIVFGLSREPRLSPAVRDALRQGCSPAHRDMRTVCDFVAGKLAWVYDLNYPAARAEFRRRNYLEQLRSHLPVCVPSDFHRPSALYAFRERYSFLHCFSVPL